MFVNEYKRLSSLVQQSVRPSLYGNETISSIFGSFSLTSFLIYSNLYLTFKLNQNLQIVFNMISQCCPII